MHNAMHRGLEPGAESEGEAGQARAGRGVLRSVPDYLRAVTHAITDEAYAGYDAARSGAAIGSRGPRGWLQISGPDAVSFLHGVLTNDVASLAQGQWRYAAYLTPQGRMVSDMRVLRRAEDVVLETRPLDG